MKENYQRYLSIIFFHMSRDLLKSYQKCPPTAAPSMFFILLFAPFCSPPQWEEGPRQPGCLLLTAREAKTSLLISSELPSWQDSSANRAGGGRCA